jgi:hypothetical protein
MVLLPAGVPGFEGGPIDPPPQLTSVATTPRVTDPMSRFLLRLRCFFPPAASHIIPIATASDA